MSGFNLEKAVELYGRELFARAWALLCDWHEAEDAVQDAFVSAYTHRGSFDGRSERAWLHRITYNNCMDRLRRRKDLPLEELGEAETGVCDRYDTGYSPAVIRALAGLKPVYCALVLGRVQDGLSYAELAERLGLSEDAARKRYERAKKRLAESLREAQKEGGYEL